MKKYTVLLEYPDCMRPHGLESYLAHVNAVDVQDAIDKAQLQAVYANEMDTDEAEYFLKIAVFAGHLEDLSS